MNQEIHSKQNEVKLANEQTQRFAGKTNPQKTYTPKNERRIWNFSIFSASPLYCWTHVTLWLPFFHLRVLPMHTTDIASAMVL